MIPPSVSGAEERIRRTSSVSLLHLLPSPVLLSLPQFHLLSRSLHPSCCLLFLSTLFCVHLLPLSSSHPPSLLPPPPPPLPSSSLLLHLPSVPTFPSSHLLPLLSSPPPPSRPPPTPSARAGARLRRCGSGSLAVSPLATERCPAGGRWRRPRRRRRRTGGRSGGSAPRATRRTSPRRGSLCTWRQVGSNRALLSASRFP